MAYKGKVKYKIDLRKIFDRTYKAESIDKRNALRKFISDPDIRRAYGLKVIDEIYKRTTVDNWDKNGAPFKAYSKAYKDSQIFSIYSKDNTVNLTLTGSMLNSMDAAPTKLTEVTISFTSEENAAKAHGHINGIKSKKYGKVIRDFFGLPEQVENMLLKDVIGEESRDNELLASRISEGLTFTQGEQNIEAESEL